MDQIVIESELNRHMNLISATKLNLNSTSPYSQNSHTRNHQRMLSICNTGYRIFTNFLLQWLVTTIAELGNYLASFLNTRSTDDRIIALRRILDEFALNIEKAFDSGNPNALRDIFLNRTNKALINRIIKTCINEITCIKWFGQQTKWITKGKGVKQAWPLSSPLLNEQAVKFIRIILKS